MRFLPAAQYAERLNDSDMLITSFKCFAQHEIDSLQEDLVLFWSISLCGNCTHGSMKNGTCLEDIAGGVQCRIQDGNVGVELIVEARIARAGVSLQVNLPRSRFPTRPTIQTRT